MVIKERKTEWAILLRKCAKLAVGEKVIVKIISPWSSHGGSCLDRSMKAITISSIEKIGPNMSLVKTDTIDYYMYSYDFSDKSLCFPANEQWHAVYTPEVRKQILFSRATAKTNFKNESRVTNPVFRIDAIHSTLMIAWCKDKSIGDDIGYVIESSSCDGAPTGNYYWLWDTCILSPGQEEDCKITLDISGEEVSTCVKLTPKSATAVNDNVTIIEGEDGNFYIRLMPINYCWQE